MRLHGLLLALMTWWFPTCSYALNGVNICRIFPPSPQFVGRLGNRFTPSASPVPICLEQSLPILTWSFCGLAFDSEKQRPGPPRAGNQAGNLRETLVAGALVLAPVGFDIHQVNPIAPLANQSCSGTDARRASEGGIISFFECATEIKKSLLTTGHLSDPNACS